MQDELGRKESRRAAALAGTPTLRLDGDMLGREAGLRDWEFRQTKNWEQNGCTSGSVNQE